MPGRAGPSRRAQRKPGGPAWLRTPQYGNAFSRMKPQSRRRLVYILAFTLIVVGASVVSYLFGAFSYNRELWPMLNLPAAKKMISPFKAANGAVTDKFGRLVGFRGKQSIQCPHQTDRTMVLLIAGQSNAANSGGQRYLGRQTVVNYWGGACYVASSPLLGATGVAGDSWTLLGNKLVERQIADQVILVATAISGSGVGRWQDGGDLNIMFRSVISDVAIHYRITQVLWHQGEWDLAGGMTTAEYVQKFTSLVESIRRMGINAPVYVSVATRCDLTSTLWTADNPIASAQKAIPDNEKRIFQGVDTDALVGPLDRTDGCHFAQSGQEKFAEAWVGFLDKHRGNR